MYRIPYIGLQGLDTDKGGEEMTDRAGNLPVLFPLYTKNNINGAYASQVYPQYYTSEDSKTSTHSATNWWPRV